MINSMLIPVLSILADGARHKAIAVELELRKTLPLAMTIRTEGTLISLSDDGLASETDYDHYTITPAGASRLAELRTEASRPVVKTKKQAALFA